MRWDILQIFATFIRPKLWRVPACCIATTYPPISAGSWERAMCQLCRFVRKLCFQLGVGAVHQHPKSRNCFDGCFGVISMIGKCSVWSWATYAYRCPHFVLRSSFLCALGSRVWNKHVMYEFRCSKSDVAHVVWRCRSRHCRHGQAKACACPRFDVYTCQC